MHCLFLVVLPSLLASQVLGHGYVNHIYISGKSYSGNPPAESNQKSASIIRQIANMMPVKGTNNPFLACGSGATAASLVADANPGDTVGFEWKGAGQAPWPHVAGPILTYMASCGSVACDKFDPSNAKWFKISQLGKKPNGLWYMGDVHDGKVIEVQIPSTLAPGNYIIRQEIIALHIAMSMGGVEFYPSCTQLRVKGSQTGRPDPSDLVSLPGAYRDNDPGLYVPGIFEPGFKYTMPGPAIARIAQGGSAGAGNGPSAPTSTSKKPASTSTKADSGGATSTPVVVKPPASHLPAAPPAAPSPVTVRVCHRRKRSLLQQRAGTDLSSPATVAPAPDALYPPILPSRARHFRRGLSRLDHNSYL